jgi:hypothetical protein
MEKKRNGMIGSALVIALVMWLPLLPDLSGLASAVEPVLRTAPAANCAVITSMTGFPQLQTSSLVEKEILMEGEGVVIRESEVKNGKIVIPPAGLYYTVRTHWAKGELRWPLANYPILLLGKTYYLADTLHNYGVKKDFAIKKGEAIPFGMGGNALELMAVENSWGEESPNHPAVFRILKPSGNYYANQFCTTTGGPFVRTAEDALSRKPKPAPIFFQQNPLASVGIAYLIVKEATPGQALVDEWVFSEVKTVDIAEKAVVGSVAVGETFDLGKYRAKVLNIDPSGKTAKVAILNAGGAVMTEKTLGPLTDKVLFLLPSYDADLETLLLKHDNVEVGLAAYSHPFNEAGKVKLVGYINTFQTTVGGPWKDDPRFVVYHDT